MENSIINRVGNTLRNSLLQENPDANIELSERVVSLGTGTFITLKGISNIFSSPNLSLIELGVGGLLLYRGITGYCPLMAVLRNQRDIEPEELIITRTTDTISTAESIGSTGNKGWTEMI